MNKLRHSLHLLSLSSFALLAACGGADDGESVEMLESELSVPSFVVTKTTDFGCGDVVRDKFASNDSAHGFNVDAKKGRSYHFEFRGDFAGSPTATLAVFDAATKQRVAFERGRERLALDFTPTADKKYLVAAYTSRRNVSGTYGFKQFCAIDGQNELAEAQTAFISEEAQQSFFRGPMAESSRADSTSKAAPNGRSGPVEEADVYKIDGTRLFYLNTYRGFLVYDVANPKAPALVSRLPVYGNPVEMFVQNGIVYALMSDVLELKDVEGRLRFEKKRASQIVAIDVTNPAKPVVLERIDIKGKLREGLSRKVGNSIYVVTQDWSWSASGSDEKEQAWVYSFDVANPQDIKKIQQLKVFEGGAGNTDAAGVSSGSWFDGVTISATSNALMVTENWQTYSSVWGSGYACGQSTSLQKAKVSLIDISNPSGAIRLHAKFETYGRLGDQFKQTYTVDPVTKKAHYLGVFARQEWSSIDCQGQSHTENALESWDVTNGAQPVRVSKLPFGKPNEVVRGTAFDDTRGILYAITAERVDPLYAISFANPAQPKILSQIDGLSGDMSLFRFIGGRKFILAVGTDNSNECQGFNSPATGFTSRVQASIIDVADAAKIRLVQRKCITVNDAQWVNSEVNWNLDQAHKLIGLHEDGVTNLVTVPVHYTKKVPALAGGWESYKSETAVGMLSWDLTKYDATKPPEQQTVLDNASTIVHPAGEVKRSVIYTQPGAVAKRKLLNLSNTHMSIVDIQNPKAPVNDSVVELAPYKDRVFSFGNYVVEQIQPSTDYGWVENGMTELRVKARGPNVDGAPAVATFSLPGVERALKFGDDALVLFQRKTTQTAGNYVSTLTATVYDMTLPASPRRAGSVLLPVEYLSYPRFSAGVSSHFFPSWGDATDMVETNDGFVFLTSSWANDATVRKLVGLNLSNVDAPKLSQVTLSASADVTMLGLARDEATFGDAGGLWLSFSKRSGTKEREGTTFDLVKYSAQRFAWNGTNLAPGITVNVPGKLVKSYVSGGQRKMVTQDRVFDLQKDGGFQESPRVSVLTLVGTKAKLGDSEAFWGMHMRELIVDDGRLYTNLAERRASFGFHRPMMDMRGKMAWTAPASELRILSVGDAIAERFAEDLGTDGIELMGVHDRKLFISLAGDGVMVVDTNDATKPVARDFVRTLGYAWSVEVAGTDALIPAGHYGTYQVSLIGNRRLGKN